VGAAVKVNEMGWISALVLIYVRSLLLWLVIPAGLIVWIFVFPLLQDRGVTLTLFLSWLDHNLIVMIQRGLLRPFRPFIGPRWIPARKMAKVEHRFKWNDPL